MAFISSSFLFDPFLESGQDRCFLLFSSEEDAHPYRVILYDTGSHVKEDHIEPRHLSSVALVFEKSFHMSDTCKAAALASGVHRDEDGELCGTCETKVMTVEYNYFLGKTYGASERIRQGLKLVAPLSTSTKIWLD